MIFIKSLSAVEVKKIIKKNKCLAFIPLGSVEQHGPFLPLNTDILISEYFTNALAEKSEKSGYSSVIYPAVYYSPAKSASNYQGNVSIGNETFRNYLKDIMSSIIDDGFKAVVIVNGHGINEAPMNEVVFNLVNSQFSPKTDLNKIIPILTVNTFFWNRLISEELDQPTGRHADWVESAILYKILGKKFFTPELIKKISALEKSKAIISFNILGAPIELRSKEGTVGGLLPEKMSLKEASEKICRIIEEKSFDLLDNFLNLKNYVNWP